MTQAECQAVAAVIVTANKGPPETAKYLELRNLMRAAASAAAGGVGNTFTFGAAALAVSTISGNAAVNLAGSPSGCSMTVDISTPTAAAAANGDMNFNTNTGA